MLSFPTAADENSLWYGAARGLFGRWTWIERRGIFQPVDGVAVWDTLSTSVPGNDIGQVILIWEAWRGVPVSGEAYRLERVISVGRSAGVILR